MDVDCSNIPYNKTGYFSALATDYIAADEKLQPFYIHPVSIDGVKASIQNRKNNKTDRKLLVDVLKQQYSDLALTSTQQKNIEQLLLDNTFTITTAHQPNIFTGPLYFIYKILHAIKLADELKKQLPENNYVPVYYMGSEDADLEELNHFYINEEKHAWETKQTGAFGRMKVDKEVLKMIDTVAGELTIHPFGKEIIEALKSFYKENETIEQSTFLFVNYLFAEYGLLILLPDNSALKKAFIPVMEKELTTQFSNKAVQQTVANFPKEYKVQASGREINLFYLIDDKRERIELENSIYRVEALKLEFTEEEILNELNEHTERFSPNVILRPGFQETILPNIAFIGGGGEIAYWLELKEVFANVNVPYPLLIVRNSFLLIRKDLQLIADKLNLSNIDLFKNEQDLLNELVKKESALQLNLDQEKKQLIALYKQLQDVSGKIDITLAQHTVSLQTQAVKKIEALEKKMLRAEKRKFEAQQLQLQKLKKHLFPNNNLQERIDNFLPYYAKDGKDFIKMIYDNSLGLEQEFGVMMENN